MPVPSSAHAQGSPSMSPTEDPADRRPSYAAGDDVPALRNEQLATIFHEIADVLEITGELPFKIGAYRRAADSIAHTPGDVVAAYRAGTPPRLEGVGKAIDEKLAELADTGRLRYHEQLLTRGTAVAGDAAQRARHRAPDGRGPVARAGHRHARGPGAGRPRGSPAHGQGHLAPRPRRASSTASRTWRRGRRPGCTWPKRATWPSASRCSSRRIPVSRA